MSLRELTEEYLGSLKYVKEIPRRFGLGESADIIAMIGPRRVGKTFTLLKRVRKLLNEGALQELKLKRATSITRDEEEEIQGEGYTIRVTPLWKWLLNMRSGRSPD